MRISGRQAVLFTILAIVAILLVTSPWLFILLVFGCLPALLVLAILYYAFKGFSNR